MSNQSPAKSAVPFLQPCTVSHFAVRKQHWGIPPWPPYKEFKHTYYTAERTPNKNPGTIFTIIGVSYMKEGVTDYIGNEEGYSWEQRGNRLVYLVAATPYRRFKAFPEDVTLQ